MKLPVESQDLFSYAYRSPHPQAFCERTAKVRVILQITGIYANIFQEKPVKTSHWP
jgi:hypothetical protein